MKVFLLRYGLLALAVAAGSCTKYGVFQDVGNEPHPPRVEVLGVAYTPIAPPAEAVPEPTTTSTTTTATTETVPELPPPDFKPADGFEIVINDTTKTSLVVRVRFADAGGDIVAIMLRDRDGKFLGSGSPAPPEVDLNGDGILDTINAPDFFTGTSGIVDILNVTFTSTMLGAHRMELWAEDSHGTRSTKVTFTFNVVLATQ